MRWPDTLLIFLVLYSCDALFNMPQLYFQSRRYAYANTNAQIYFPHMRKTARTLQQAVYGFVSTNSSARIHSAFPNFALISSSVNGVVCLFSMAMRSSIVIRICRSPIGTMHLARWA